jgi:glyoxylase-like metal-dependent hydrolase (beta-lactamase superfamily II)
MIGCCGEVAPGVVRFRDTCNLIALRSGPDGVLVDFGSGAVLEHLDELGVDRITHVLVTHHHRDQLRGLARAVERGVHEYRVRRYGDVSTLPTPRPHDGRPHGG